jgi:hypothetical protein
MCVVIPCSSGSARALSQWTHQSHAPADCVRDSLCGMISGVSRSYRIPRLPSQEESARFQACSPNNQGKLGVLVRSGHCVCAYRNTAARAGVEMVKSPSAEVLVAAWYHHVAVQIRAGVLQCDKPLGCNHKQPVMSEKESAITYLSHSQFSGICQDKPTVAVTSKSEDCV